MEDILAAAGQSSTISHFGCLGTTCPPEILRGKSTVMILIAHRVARTARMVQRNQRSCMLFSNGCPNVSTGDVTSRSPVGCQQATSRLPARCEQAASRVLLGVACQQN